MKLAAIRPARGRARTPCAAVARVRGSGASRGQSLTELALILPVLLLLTVAALDFGRIYLGYVNVQNMARIAANYAANNPLAWGVTPDTAIQDRYANQVREDASATNCTLPVSDGAAVIPPPTFIDTDADGTTVMLGDAVRVRITCSFAVLTPLIGSVLGGSVAVTAESDFPVKAGMTSVLTGGAGGGGGGVLVPPNAAFEAGGVFTTEHDHLVVTGPNVTVTFRDASGGGPATSWSWSIDDTSNGVTLTATTQDYTHDFACTNPNFFGWCSYLVTFTPSNAAGSSTAYLALYVDAGSVVDFTLGPAIVTNGQAITVTDRSTAGGTDFRWDFGDGTTQSGAALTTVSHTYATTGTFTVREWVTYPDPIGERGPASKTASVSPGYCTVPSLTNVRFNDATGVWRGSPYNFTGAVKRAAGAPSGNFKITAQSIAAGSGATALCNSDVYVSAP